MSSGAVDKKLSICFIDIPRGKKLVYRNCHTFTKQNFKGSKSGSVLQNEAKLSIISKKNKCNIILNKSNIVY
jgi:hypothetical protein